MNESKVSQNPPSLPYNLPEYASLDNYGQAFFLAQEAFLKSDLKNRAGIAEADFIEENDKVEIQLPFLNDRIIISVFAGKLDFKFQNGAEVPMTEKILALHYLLNASTTPPAGEWIGFEAIPDGRLYISNFFARTHRPLLKKFGKQPELLIESAKKLGGEKFEFGDLSVLFRAFPKIPVIIIFWRGDEEFEPEVKIIFDRNITHHLSAEDIVILCNLIALKLVK